MTALTLGGVPEDDDIYYGELSWAVRIGTIVLGAAAGAAGAVAVFVTSNDVGSTSLLATGLLLVLYGANGTPLVSAQLGKNALLLARRREARVAQLLESVSDPLQTEIAQAILEAGYQGDDPLARRAEAVLYGNDVLDALEAVVTEARGIKGAQLSVAPGDSKADAIVTLPRGRSIAVVIKAATSPGRADALIHEVESLDPKVPVLIVTRGGLTRRAEANMDRLYAEGRAVSRVQWSGPEDNARLLQAVRSLERA